MFPLNTFENLCVFFLLLMIYSAAGWVGEMFYCSVPTPICVPSATAESC